MLPMLLHCLVPTRLYGGKTAYRAVSRLDRDLQRCRDSGEAAAVVERSKSGLYACLRRRLPPVAAQALVVKMLNICLAKYHFRARNSAVLSRPVGLVVDPSNVCRLACPGCVHSERVEKLRLFDWGKGTLSLERFSALLARYGPYAIGISLYNYGEPLLNLHTPQFIRLAKNYLLWTALSTSLSVSRFDATALVQSGLDFMALSIDGATQPVYQRFRRNGNLELVLANVRALVNAKRKLGQRTPVLAWNFLAFEHNAHEIPMAKQMARGLGVNFFRVANPFDVTWDDPDMWPAAARQSLQPLDWHSRVHVPPVWGSLPDDAAGPAIASAFERRWTETVETHAEAPNPGPTCHWLYQNMVMDATGRIMPCCAAPRPDNRLVFATFDGNGADPFNAEKYRAARSALSSSTPVVAAGEGVPYCPDCEWDRSAVSIGGHEIARYFRAADPVLFDPRTLGLLANWT